MDPRVAPLARVLRLNAQLLVNCVDGLSDEQADTRVLPAVNSVSFLVAHLTDARYTLLGVLGGVAENPHATLLADARGIDDVPALPPLAELVEAWWTVDGALASRLAAVTAEALDERAPHSYPGGDPSVLGTLAFLTQHDSYHIGQLAMLRRALGFPAMRYGRPRAAT
jgi:uncharacterized damage-inducible protein DinB